MRIIITGDRHWPCPALAELVVGRLVARYSPALVLIHGAAWGVDQAFAEAAEDAGVVVESYPAQWGEIHHPGTVVRHDRNGHPYDSAAGPRRNALMTSKGECNLPTPWFMVSAGPTAEQIAVSGHGHRRANGNDGSDRPKPPPCSNCSRW